MGEYEEDIAELFERISRHFSGETDDGTREMFSMLVSTTLKYRDMLKHSTGKPLTVGETRSALDFFMQVLRTHRMPEGMDKRVKDLVVLWLEELKLRINNRLS